MNIYSQQNYADSSKWKISYLVSGNYTYRTVNSNFKTEESYLRYGWTYTADDQIPANGFHASILISRKIVSKFYFQTGLFLDRKALKTNAFVDTVLEGSPFGGWSYVFYKRHLDFNFLSLGVPSFVNFSQRLCKKIFFESTIGICINFVQRVNVIYDGPNYSQDPYYTGGQIKLWQYMLYGKLGLCYLYRPNSYLSVSPTFSYLLTPYEDGLTSDPKKRKLNLYSAGIEAGLHFYLGRKK